MGLLPDYRFTLISDLPRISTLGSVGVEWTSVGGGDPWTNGSTGIQYISSAFGSDNLVRPTTFVAGKKYNLAMNFTSIIACQVIISCGTSQFVYTLNAKAAPSPTRLICEFVTFANTVQDIQISLKSLGTGLNFSFNYILLQEQDSLTRVIQPGGWKTLARLSERDIQFYGFNETLEGALEIFGDDWVWLKGYLVPSPDKKFKIKVDIDAGSGFEDYFVGLIDTLALNIAGIELTYKAELNILKDTEWSRFVSFLETPIDNTANKGVHGLDTIDLRGSDRIVRPTLGLEPRLIFQFDGNANATTNLTTFAADDNQSLGFGDTTKVNDGFDTFSGLQKDYSISLPVGRIRGIIGEVKVTWVAPAGSIVVEAEVSNAGGWVALTSGVGQPIFLTDAYYNPGVSGWSVRVRNTVNNASRTFRVSGETYLRFTSVTVEYDLLPYMVAPLIGLKSFTNRILGNYDNLLIPAFEDENTYQSSGSAINMAVQFQNPPPIFKPFNITTGAFPCGNYYSGGSVNWIQLTAPDRAQCTASGAGTFSNLLVLRFLHAGRDGSAYTAFSAKGLHQMSVSGFVAVANPSLQIYVYGILDNVLTLLHTYNNPLTGSNLLQQFQITQYYEAICIGISGGTATFEQLLVSPVYGSGIKGKYHLNAIGKGYELIATSAGAPAPTIEPSARAMSDVLVGLCKIFGLGIQAEIVNNRTKLVIDDVNTLFVSALGVTVFAQEFITQIDALLVRDTVAVGGSARQELLIDQQASCSKAEYVTTFISAKNKVDLEFNIALNSALILNRELDNDELFLLELLSKTSDTIYYRTSDGLTISGSPSPRQPNWMHSEGRIVRRSNSIISSMGSSFLVLTSGVSSTLVRVDNPADGLGSIADADLILPQPIFTPWLVSFSTAMTYAEYKAWLATKNNRLQINISGIIKTAYVKLLRYNATLGTAIISGWLVASGDFSTDFSNDFANEPIAVAI